MRLAVRLPLLLVAGVAAAATAGGTVALRAAGRSFERQALDASVHSVHAYASAVATHLDDAAHTLETTAADQGITDLLAGTGPGAAPPPALRVAGAILRNSPVFETVMLVRLDGSVAVLEPPSEAGAAPRSLDYTAWYRKLLDTGRTVISGLHISASTQRPTVVVATPARDDAGVLRGIWAGALRLEAFSALGRVAPEGQVPDSYGFVTDGRGLIIAHQANPDYVRFQTDFGSVPPVAAALQGREGSGRWRNPLDGDEKLGAYLPVSGSGWTAVYSTPTSVALAPLRRLAKTIVASLLIVVAFLGLSGVLLARRLTRPLRRLGDASGRIAAGDREARVDITGDHEVAELAARFNTMVAALAGTERELRAKAEGLEHANAELEAFAYSVSHDLRAPLRSIDGFSQILLEDYSAVLDGEGQDHLTRVRSATQRMGRLIDDLLGLSRVGRAELRRETVDVSALCERIAAELRDTAPDRDTRVVIAPGLTTEADPALTAVVLRNLLDNAWKFTSRTPGATIEVSSAGPGSFFVRDEGAGFDMAYAGRLFGAFQRLHATTEFAGTGIGLATVARVVHRHDGWIRAVAEVGRGATFSFALSGAVPPPPDRAPGQPGDRDPTAPPSTLPVPLPAPA